MIESLFQHQQYKTNGVFDTVRETPLTNVDILNDLLRKPFRFVSSHVVAQKTFHAAPLLWLMISFTNECFLENAVFFHKMNCCERILAWCSTSKASGTRLPQKIGLSTRFLPPTRLNESHQCFLDMGCGLACISAGFNVVTATCLYRNQCIRII